MTRRPAVLLVALALAGCGGGEGDEGAAVTTAAPPQATTTISTAETGGRLALRVYFAREGKLAAARRLVPETSAVARASLERLLEGRDQVERQAGIGSAVPRETRLVDVSIADGLASVELSDEFEAGGELALAQVVYTLTQFPAVERVAVNDGEPRTRDDFEDLTPAILVESPLSTETVRNPMRLTGTANTFEAVFNAELVDATGRVVAEAVVTATSGSGTRGNFEAELPVGEDAATGPGALVVYETSAEDGSRIHTLEIPVLIARS